MPKQTPSINLVKKKDIPIIDRAINWALNIGRSLVVLTEVVALSAFVYRFSLDRKIIDLHTAIAQRTLEVNFFANDEKTYRNLQDRLASAKSLSQQEKQNLDIFTTIMNLNTDSAAFDNFSLFQKTLRIEATFSSPASLTNLVNSLKSDPTIATVSIDRIATKQQAARIIADITAVLK